MKSFYFLFSFVVTIGIVNAQIPTIEWDQTLGGTFSDQLRSSYPTDDGGVIVGGRSLSDASADKSENNIGEFDYWVVKLNSDGNIEWENTIGGSNADELQTVRPTLDGGYIVGGTSKSNTGFDKSEDVIGGTPAVSFRDYWIVKLDALGNVVWDETLGGNQDDSFQTLLVLDDGGFLLIGASNSEMSGDKSESSVIYDAWIVKIDATGNVVWEKTIGGNLIDAATYGTTTNDDGFVIVTISNSDASGDKSDASFGSDDYWIFKLNSDGEIVWDKAYGGSDSDSPRSIYELEDGSFIIGGESLSNASGSKSEDSFGEYDYWIVKIDSEGSIIWENTIGGSTLDAQGHAVPLASGGFLVSGWSDSPVSGEKTALPDGGFDFWTLRLDSSGNIDWQDCFGGNGQESMFQTDFYMRDGSLFLGGSSLSGVSGDKSEPNLGSNDYWVLKINNVLGAEEVNNSFGATISPNPTEDFLTISSEEYVIDKVSIFSMLGRKLKEFTNMNNNSINISTLTPNTYLICIEAQGRYIVKKFIKK